MDKKICPKIYNKIKKKFSKIELFVIKHNNERFGMSKPCANCIYVIKKLGFKNVCYSTMDKIVIEKVKYLFSDHLSQAALSGL